VILLAARSLSCWSRTDHEGPDTRGVLCTTDSSMTDCVRVITGHMVIHY